MRFFADFAAESDASGSAAARAARGPRPTPTRPRADLTTTPLTSLDGRENRWANDTDGFALAAQTGQVAGAANEKAGSQPIAQEPACPTCVRPRSPCPSRATVATTNPDGASEKQFHAPKRAASAARREIHRRRSVAIESESRASAESATAIGRPAGLGALRATAAAALTYFSLRHAPPSDAGLAS